MFIRPYLHLIFIGVFVCAVPYRGSSDFAFVPGTRERRGWIGHENKAIRSRAAGAEASVHAADVVVSDPYKTTCRIDYGAANEFIVAHYPHLYSKNQTYFVGGGSDSRYKDELVFNARMGYIHPITGQIEERVPNIIGNGFTLVNHPTNVTDFTNMSQIKSTYLPELKSVLVREFNISDENAHILFWNPVIRGESIHSTKDRIFHEDSGMLLAPAVSTIAGMVHIDTDIGAHETPESFLSIVYKNLVRSAAAAEEDDNPSLYSLSEKIKKGHRFAIINFWRNANRLNPVIQRSPLGLYSPHYVDFNNSCAPSSFGFFPKSRPDPHRSRWYYYPNMTYDECLVFKQYDRDARYPSDVWHSALKFVTTTTRRRHDNARIDDAPPRLSFDFRALVVYKSEIVPERRDRYSVDRIRPVMSFEESGNFCNEQASERKRRS